MEQTAWEPVLAVQPFGEILLKQPGSISGASLLSTRMRGLRPVCIAPAPQNQSWTSRTALQLGCMSKCFSKMTLDCCCGNYILPEPFLLQAKEVKLSCSAHNHPQQDSLSSSLHGLGNSIQVWSHQCQIKGNNPFLCPDHQKYMSPVLASLVVGGEQLPRKFELNFS